MWYWVALLVFVAGAAWLVLGLVLLSGRIDSFERVAALGSGEVSLDHSGDYVIYYEGPGAADDSRRHCDHEYPTAARDSETARPRMIDISLLPFGNRCVPNWR